MRGIALTLGVVCWTCVACEDPAPGDYEAFTIRGRIVDEAGQPIEGGCVLLAKSGEVTTRGALDDPTVRSGADGRFELIWESPTGPGAPLEERQELLITAPGRSAVSWSDGSDRQVWLVSRVIDIGDAVLLPAVQIEGRVRRADGRPLPGAWVAAIDPMAEMSRGFASTPKFRATSVATADEKGAFRLDGVVPPAAALFISAEGYYRAELPFVAPRDPLVVVLEESGWIEGTVYDREGVPVRAALITSYEVAERRDWASPADEEGRFRISLDYPHHYRLSGWLWDGAVLAEWGDSAILSGPRDGVEVRPGHGDVTTMASVRVLDADSQQLVKDAAAAAIWMDPEHLTDQEVDAWFAFRQAKAREPGRVLLRGPEAYESSTGMIVVRAPGYAPTRFSNVHWDDEDPPRVEARLTPESAVAGTVVDGVTGEPLEGATVVAGSEIGHSWWTWNSGRRGQGEESTDEAGCFRIGMLAEGKHELRAVFPERPDSPVQTITLGDREERGGVTFAIPPGASLRGKLVGAGTTVGWKAKLITDDYEPWAGNDAHGRNSRVVPVDHDGTFEIRGLAPDDYRLHVLCPERHHRGGHLELPIGSVQIAESDVQRDFDVSTELPATITGRVDLAGIPFRAERLVVVALRKNDDRGTKWLEWERPGSRGPVAEDGTFHLDVREGEHKLVVVDLATRVVLLESEDTWKVRAGTVTEVRFDLELTMVRVLLEPERAGGEVAVSALVVDVQQEHDDADDELAPVWEHGLSLADGKREVVLFLPEAQTRISVHSSAKHVLNPRGPWFDLEPLAEHELVPELGEVNRVHIKVPPPPDLRE